MEIGDQTVHTAETVTGVDKNTGIAAHCMQNAVFVRRTFQCADRGCAYSDDASPLCFGTIDGLGGFFGNREEF